MLGGDRVVHALVLQQLVRRLDEKQLQDALDDDRLEDSSLLAVRDLTERGRVVLHRLERGGSDKLVERLVIVDVVRRRLAVRAEARVEQVVRRCRAEQLHERRDNDLPVLCRELCDVALEQLLEAAGADTRERVVLLADTRDENVEHAVEVHLQRLKVIRVQVDEVAQRRDQRRRQPHAHVLGALELDEVRVAEHAKDREQRLLANRVPELDAEVLPVRLESAEQAVERNAAHLEVLTRHDDIIERVEDRKPVPEHGVVLRVLALRLAVRELAASDGDDVRDLDNLGHEPLEHLDSLQTDLLEFGDLAEVGEAGG